MFSSVSFCTHSRVSLLVMRSQSSWSEKDECFYDCPEILTLRPCLRPAALQPGFILQAGKTNSLLVSGGWSGFSGKNTVFFLSVSLSVSCAFWNSLKEGIWEGGSGILSVLYCCGSQIPCCAFHTTGCSEVIVACALHAENGLVCLEIWKSFS